MQLDEFRVRSNWAKQSAIVQRGRVIDFGGEFESRCRGVRDIYIYIYYTYTLHSLPHYQLTKNWI